MDFFDNSSSLPEPGSAASFGLPSNDPTPTNPLVNIADPAPSSHSGFFDSLEEAAGSFVEGAESAASSLYHGAVSTGTAIASGAETIAEKGYSVAKTVTGDVVGGVEGIVNFGTTQVVVLVAVLGVALYFIGKTGAIKVSV